MDVIMMDRVDMTKRLVGVLALVALSMGGPGDARAQAPAAEIFEPQAVGATSIWSVATSEVPGHMMPSLGLTAHYADDPVVLRLKGREPSEVRLVDEQLKLEVGLGLGLFDRLEIGLVLPVVVYQSGETIGALAEPNTVELAEARAQLRAKLVQIGGFGLGAQLTAYLPASGQTPYQSSGSASALGSLIADYGQQGPMPWRVAANVGWAFEPETRDALLQTDDRLDVRLGAEVEVLPDRLALMATGFGRWEAFADPRHALSAGYLGGARVRWGQTGLSSTVGAGGAIGSGYGTPKLRVVLSLAYAPDERKAAEPAETMSDASPEQNEPAQPEPAAPVAWARDFDEACRRVTGAAEAAKCSAGQAYDTGADAALKRCAAQAEGAQGAEAGDDCPVPATDDDAAAKACPDGVEDCPEDEVSSVMLVDDRIEILERVYFDTNRARIKSRSHSLLRQVARLLKENPDIKLLRIQGHTDSRGDEGANLELSQQRAVSVKEYLVKQGIDPRRLSARGYGESHPIADNQRAEGRAQNRRVEFHVIERDQK